MENKPKFGPWKRNSALLSLASGENMNTSRDLGDQICENYMKRE